MQADNKVSELSVQSAEKPKRLAWLKALNKYKWIYIALLPTFIFLAIFKYYPFFNAFYRSLFEWNGVNHSEFIGLGNFVEMFTSDPMFYPALKVMAIFTVADIIKGIAVPLIVAVLIHHLRSEKAKYYFRILLILPAVVPGVVGALLWKDFLSSDGLINQLLMVMGLGEYAQTWLANENTAIGALIFLGFPWLNGVNTLILISGLLTISQDVYDSSRLDGASGLQRLFKIEMPMIIPQISLIIILSIIGSVQNYENILIITGGGPYGSTMVPGLLLFKNAFEYSRVGYGSAIGVLLFFIIITLTIINRKINKQS